MNTSHVKVCAASISWALLLFLGLAAPVQADENPSEKQATGQPKPKTVFELYCGNCSRSMQYHSSHAFISEVIYAAGQASEKWLRTEIMSSDLPNGIKTRYSPKLQVRYQVFARTCKAWSLHSSHDSLTDANKATKKLSESQQAPYQIVPHYTRSEDVVSKR
jgi:hypothetical protein